MPNSSLPTTDYLGDGQRTTAEFQTQINNLQNWVIALQSELNALSGTTLGEGAVRDVGTGSSDLVEVSALEGLLGDYLAKSDFDPENATLVWSGSATSVAMSSLSKQGAGFYAVKNSSDGTVRTFVIYIEDTNGRAFGSNYISGNAATDLVSVFSCNYSGSSFFVEAYLLDLGSGSFSGNNPQSIIEIYKV